MHTENQDATRKFEDYDSVLLQKQNYEYMLKIAKKVKEAIWDYTDIKTGDDDGLIIVSGKLPQKKGRAEDIMEKATIWGVDKNGSENIKMEIDALSPKEGQTEYNWIWDKNAFLNGDNKAFSICIVENYDEGCNVQEYVFYLKDGEVVYNKKEQFDWLNVENDVIKSKEFRNEPAENINSEQDLINMIEQDSGLNVLLWGYDDYDENGSYELFGYVGVKGEWDETSCSIWYSDGINTMKIAELQDGYMGEMVETKIIGEEKCFYLKRLFFMGNIQAFSSACSVIDGKPFIEFLDEAE